VKAFPVGVVVGAVAWWITLGFLGWMSEGTAKQMVTQQTQEAVVAMRHQPASPDSSIGIKSGRAWKTSRRRVEQSDAVEKGGWIAEPGQKLDSSISRAIADRCAAQSSISGDWGRKAPHRVARIMPSGPALIGRR